MEKMLSSLSLSPLPPISLRALLPNTFASIGTVTVPVPNEFPSFISFEAFDKVLSGSKESVQNQTVDSTITSFLRLTIGSPQVKEKNVQNLVVEVPASPSTSGGSSRQKNGKAKRNSTPKVTFSSEANDRYKEANMYLTVFERAKLIAVRAAQIANGSQSTIITTGMRSSFDIAKKELYDKRFPLKLQRAWPNGRIEMLDPNRMIILDPDIVVTPNNIEGIPSVVVQQTPVKQEIEVRPESPRETIKLNDFDDTGFPYPDPERLSLTREFLNQITKSNVHITFNPSKSESVDISMTQEHDKLNMISTIIQSKSMLRTRLRLGAGPKSILLQSALQVWSTNQSFREEVLAADDKWEILWRLRKNYSYKIPTPFSPLYARSIMDQLTQLMQLERGIRVLDPSSGWGDRLIGSFGARVIEYVGVDPNKDLFKGYAEIMSLYGITHNFNSGELNMSDAYVLNGAGENTQYAMICAPFESEKAIVPVGHFDAVVTSPPFFDYEVYSESNPIYKDWIKDFYTPYTQKALECLRIGGYMALHIDDTSAGNISDFIDNIPRLFSGVIHRGTIYLKGTHSHQTRPVHLFEKISL